MITCRDCGKSWSGIRKCHCAACHRTFGGEFAFTMHQGAIEGCLDPAEIKTTDGRNRLVQHEDGLWCQPAPAKSKFGVAKGSNAPLVS